MSTENPSSTGDGEATKRRIQVYVSQEDWDRIEQARVRYELDQQARTTSMTKTSMTAFCGAMLTQHAKAFSSWPGDSYSYWGAIRGLAPAGGRS